MLIFKSVPSLNSWPATPGSLVGKFAIKILAGIISTAPAFMMNKDAGDDATHPYVALMGRVPCKVTGEIRKGKMLTTSDKPGYAMEADGFHGGAIIGKAIEDFNGEEGVIEVLVNLM